MVVRSQGGQVVVKKKGAKKDPKKRPPRAEPVKAKPGDPLVLRREFPPGSIVKPPGPPRAHFAPRVTCPHCGTEDVRQTARHGSVRYYQCRKCVDEETMDWTAFKVIRRPPSSSAARPAHPAGPDG